MSRIAIPSKQIMTALAATLLSIDLDLATDPETVVDADRRRALKSAKRAQISLQDLVENIEKFEQDFTTAEAKTPKKKLLAEIEKAIQSDPKNLEKVTRALDDVIRGNMSEQIHESRPEKSAKKSVSKAAVAQSDAAARIPDTADTVDAQRGDGRASAIHAARAPRRRQKPIDPLVAAMRQQEG
ncbi:MAG: hypothetical protein J0H39_21270 [Alphaproteobacteria bacterium]|nr:hypothetical protein [Alphaproteobacteria bacterium]